MNGRISNQLGNARLTCSQACPRSQAPAWERTAHEAPPPQSKLPKSPVVSRGLLCLRFLGGSLGSSFFFLLGISIWLVGVVPVFSQERIRPSNSRNGTPAKPSGRILNRPAPVPNQPTVKQKNPNTKGTQASNLPSGSVPSSAAPSAIVAAKPMTQNQSEASVIDKPLDKNENPITVATESEKNQEIAANWEQPWACLFLTGRQHGYIEPCGCTGLENQKGGLNRRDTLLTGLRDRGWDVVPIDAGDQVRRFGRQSEIKFARTSEAFKLMKYEAVMFGPEELKLSATDLYVALTNEKADLSSPFVAANISILTPGAPDLFKVVQIGSRKIGITGVIGDELSKEITDSRDIKITPAAAALKAVAPKLKAAGCDFLILISHASLEESVELAKTVPLFDLVVTAGGYGEPYYKPEPIEGTKSVMIQVGVKGMYAGIVGLYDRPTEPIAYQRIALSSQFEDSPRIMELFGRYQKELEQTGLERLGLRPLSHPSTREFAGSESCSKCHTKAFDVWKDTPHALATDSIIKPPGRSQVARHFDPECLSCHVTGWNPQDFSPYVSGFVSLQDTPQLVANGCENCHGPGASHVRAELNKTNETKELLARLRDEMKLPLEAAQDRCLECHDVDNSPNFHKENAFQEYWEQVKHEGKD